LHTDFIVIGAGIAGSLTALELSRHGDVLIIDKEDIIGGASGRSSGIITLQLPEPLVTWSMEAIEYYTSLSRDALKRVPGVLVAPRICIDRMAANLRASGIEVSILTRAEASEVAGIPLESVGDPGFLVTMEALLDPGTLGAALRNRLSEADVEILTGREARVTGSSVRIPGLGRIEASQAVVVAAGAWTPETIGYDPSLLAGSTLYKCEAHSVEVPTPPRAIVYEDSSGAYMMPESHVTCIVGDGPNTRIVLADEGYTPDPYSVYHVLEELAVVTSIALEAVPRSSWSAPCIVPGDGLPLLGEIRDGLYVISGLDGVGLMLAPTLARMLSGHIARGEPLLPGMEPLRAAVRWDGDGPPPEPFRWGCEGED